MATAKTITVTAAARLYLEAHPEGVTLADAVAHLGPYVSDEQAEATTARMLRTNRGNTDGRKRCVQETLQKLCGAGDATATGKGDERTFKPKGAKVKAVLGELRTVPLDALTFDRRCQQRMEMFDPHTAKYYAELMDEGAVFPPLSAIDDGQTLWVYSGFNRGEAHRIRAALNSSIESPEVPVKVTAGTFLDAVLLSCRENSEGTLWRSKADVQRALSSILDNKHLLARVLESAADEGGVHRALAAACGVSNGVVNNGLKSRGLKAKGGKLVKATPLELLDDAAPKPAKPAPAQPAPLFDNEPAPETVPPLKAPVKGFVDPEDATDDEPDAEAEKPAPSGPIVADLIQAKTAVATRPEWDRLLSHLQDAAKILDAVGSGPAQHHLRAATGPDGPILTVQKTRRNLADEVVTSLPLVALIRLVRSARPSKVCGGCSGRGCRACRNAGFLPHSLELLPVQGQTGSLFDTDVGDVWE